MRPAPFGMLKEEVEILILKNKSKKYSVRCFWETQLTFSILTNEIQLSSVKF